MSVVVVVVFFFHGKTNSLNDDDDQFCFQLSSPRKQHRIFHLIVCPVFHLIFDRRRHFLMTVINVINRRLTIEIIDILYFFASYVPFDHPFTHFFEMNFITEILLVLRHLLILL